MPVPRIKTRLVVLDFMALRYAPPLRRRFLEGWLIVFTTLMLAARCLGPTILPHGG